MAYIGNNVQTQGFTPAIDYFSGNGSTVTFTLSRPVASVAQVIIAIDNVVQNSSTAYSVSGNSITFTSAPLSGTNNIWVQYTSPITTYAAISQDPSVIGDITATGGFLSTGDFGNTYTDGTIVDYVTGNARITTGPADGITFYNGGTSSRTALMAINSSGNLGIGTTNPSFALDITKGAGALAKFENTAGTNAYIYLKDTARSYAMFANNGAWGVFDNTGNATRMSIDSSGRLTVASQPAFYAYNNNSSNQLTGTSGTIQYTSTMFNVGNCFSTATGIFTAPIAGRYFFAFGTQHNAGQNTNNLTDLYVNGVIYGKSRAELFTSATYNIQTWSGVVQLAANDNVTLNSTDVHNNFTQWSGYLLG